MAYRLNEDLSKAVYKNDVVAIRELVESGVDINEADLMGSTVLMLAAEKGRVEIIRELVALGADINAQR